MLKNRLVTFTGTAAMYCAIILPPLAAPGAAAAQQSRSGSDQGGIAGTADCGPWHPFGGCQPGVNSQLQALTVWRGDLVTGGIFGYAGGMLVAFIARWHNGGWVSFNSGGEVGVANGQVYSLTVWNGDLIAGGTFLTAGGQTMSRIARWDGSSWHPFTSGGPIGVNGTVWAFTVLNGDLIAGGSFTTAGGQTVNRIARWDGSEWHPFTSGDEIGTNDIVRALTVWNGDLIAGGDFTTAGGQTVNHIARWNGSAWHPITQGGHIGVNAAVRALRVWNNNLTAAGDFVTAGGQTVNRIARWDGLAWHPFTSGGQTGFDNFVNALTPWNGDLVAGGIFESAGGQYVSHIARWESCPSLTGACCINGVAAEVPMSESGCLALGGVFQGIDTVPGEVACPAVCAGDLNSSGTVDVQDLLILLGAWGPCR
ncbi:MAG TPA: hypothetical protein PK400_11420 [Phycisphaerales bacterium]|nr:hypothetical protein [Phycisphaerales bacterium]HRQ76376.1 hypothetical protein [Phycisphaerales bacterium]